MANKPWLRKTYSIIIVPNDIAKPRKIKIPYLWLLLSGFTMVAILSILTVFLVHYIFMLGDSSKLNDLAADNIRLKKENHRYEQLTSDIRHRLDLINNKTKVLSSLAGVDQVVTRGTGDISGLENRFDNENLDRELPIQQGKMGDLEATLERVEKAFNEKREELDFTPSVWPLVSTELGYISSKMGYRPDPFTGQRTFHPGLDISARIGTPIIAPANGIVTQANSARGLGNVLVIDHMNGYITLYGHMHKFNVKKGDRVVRGQVLGTLGNTGKSTGPHLHYQIELNGKSVNPYNYILNHEKRIPIWDFQLASK